MVFVNDSHIIPSPVLTVLPENTPAAGSLLQFKLCKGSSHCWQTCFSVIADMCHHWRNIYCSWDPRLLHFHSIRGLEEDPAGQNAVAVKLYPRLQGQEQRLRNLPLPVFLSLFSIWFNQYVFFSNQAVQWRHLQQIKEISMHFRALRGKKK